MRKIVCALLAAGLYCLPLLAQDVKTLAPGQAPGKGDLGQMQWLAGYWVGTGLGGDCVETWIPAADNAMQGIFRFVMNDTLIFTEYMHLIEHDSTLTIRLKHFGADLEGWEEKSEWTEFELIGIDGQTAYFDGMTYIVKGNSLTIKLKLHEGDKEWIEEFVFKRERLGVEG